MLKSRFSRSILTAILVSAPGTVLAADLDSVLYAPQLPRTVPVEIGNGWYLRGDVSYNFSTDGDATSYRTYHLTSHAYGTQNYSTSDFETDWGVGAAVGYQLTNWFRAEAALDYYRGTFGTSTSTSSPCLSGFIGPDNTGCSIDGSAGFNSWGVMANAYVDLGTYVGFTPYVGAGVGLTQVDFKDYLSTSTCVDGAASCNALPAVSLTHPGGSDWRFTYALMAGVSYNLSKNLKADIGYRYINVDGGDTYDFDSIATAAGATGVQGTDNGYHVHQIRASLRYSLW